MILIDTGPLIALIDAGQGEIHTCCVETQRNIPGGLFTTWPCMTEAMYFLGDLRGWTGQKILWQFVERKALYILNNDEQQQQRMKVLMEKYRDRKKRVSSPVLSGRLTYSTHNC